MPYAVDAEPGETVLANVFVKMSDNEEPFYFAVSDRAVFLPAKRFQISGDPRYLRRVPKAEVSEVKVERLRPYGLWAAAGFLVLVGGVTEILMMLPLIMQVPGTHRVSGGPLALFVIGLVLPFASRDRRRLTVIAGKKPFHWNPPLVVGKAAKEKISGTLETILAACRTAGIPTKDECTPESTTTPALSTP